VGELKSVYIQFKDWGGAANKVYLLTRQAFVNKGWEIAISPDMADHIHYTRLLPPDNMANFPFIDMIGKNQTISATTFGISEPLRVNSWQHGVSKFIGDERVRRLNVLSLDPLSCKIAAYNMPALNSYVDTKMNFMYEPPMEDKELYRTNGKHEDDMNIMYFGVYNYSKGADLLLQVARSMPKHAFHLVGDTRVSTFRFDIKTLAGDNIFFHDERVAEEDMPSIFAHAGIVVLPYRSTYKHDSSAVFLQAMMAKKYVVVPNIPPFSNVLMEFDVGVAFEPENVLSLKSAIKECLDKTWNRQSGGFDKYLERIGTWDNIAGEVDG
jgi:glycosyltransferase involved in cell wall biosynthesis